MILDYSNHGALRVVLDASTGEVLAVQCRATGAAAALTYAKRYILEATKAASLAWASQYADA